MWFILLILSHYNSVYGKPKKELYAKVKSGKDEFTDSKGWSFQSINLQVDGSRGFPKIVQNWEFGYRLG